MIVRLEGISEKMRAGRDYARVYDDVFSSFFLLQLHPKKKTSSRARSCGDRSGTFFKSPEE
ncbi:hypothetical protein [Deinococcus ruber]|uniref:hypothetical protein n=1 Tax=Deinococcus ruber TaxID=1848197 RepID=UPI0016640FFC|nr:hypothetical protein [Deinococcus ruber]